MVVTTRKVVPYMAYPKNPGRALSMQDRYAGCKDDPHTAGKNSRKAKGCRILLPAVRSCLWVAPIPEKKPTPQTREAEQALCSFGLQQICPVKKDREAQGVALIVASLGVEEVEQILAWLEGGKTLAWYLYLFACVGVATGVPFIFLGLPGAQSADFHPVPLVRELAMELKKVSTMLMEWVSERSYSLDSRRYKSLLFINMRQ